MIPNHLIVSGNRMATGLLHRMTGDMTPDEFRHQPCAGANSMGWVIGHLAATLLRTADRLGETDLPAVPADFAKPFTATGKSAEGPVEFGDPAELLRLFDAALEKVIAGIQKVPADALSGPLPWRIPFATNFGEGLLFGATHLAMHVGQLSTIRRSLGKPPVV